MKKNNTISIIIICIVGVASILAYRSVFMSKDSEYMQTSDVQGDGERWMEYSDKSTGISFEFPSYEMSIRTGMPHQLTTDIIISNDASLSVQHLDMGSLATTSKEAKSLGVSLISTEVVGATTTIESWIQWEEDNSPDGITFPHLQYEDLGNLRVAVTKYSADEAHGYPHTEVFWIHNVHVWSMDIVNLSPFETERIWKSLRFSN